MMGFGVGGGGLRGHNGLDNSKGGRFFIVLSEVP